MEMNAKETRDATTSMTPVVVVENRSSKNLQAGRGTCGPVEKKCKPCKPVKIKKPVPEGCEEPVVIECEKSCASHSFCVVETLKRKGIYPIQPKGLPWASGRLLYLPGQRPKHYDKTQEEIAAYEKRKKKKKKELKKETKRVMEKLRRGDHTKLCDIMNTTQEMVLLMKVITMVMENKKAERRKILAQMQTEIDTIPEEEELQFEAEKVPEEMEEMETEIEPMPE